MREQANGDIPKPEAKKQKEDDGNTGNHSQPARCTAARPAGFEADFTGYWDASLHLLP